MTSSPIIANLGAFVFGVVIGYITYRTLARSESAGVSDLAAVVAAIGGGTVTSVLDAGQSDRFGWYSLGLGVGMATWGIAYWRIAGKQAFSQRMGKDRLRPPGSG